MHKIDVESDDKSKDTVIDSSPSSAAADVETDKDTRRKQGMNFAFLALV